MQDKDRLNSFLSFKQQPPPPPLPFSETISLYLIIPAFMINNE